MSRRPLVPGPVAPTAGAVGVTYPLDHNAVALGVGGWLGEWQQRNATSTIPHVLERVESGEARANLARLSGETDAPLHGMPFTDSDVYKTLEAIAWAAAQSGLDANTLRRAEQLVQLIDKVQEDDGYINSFVQGTPGLDRWADPQWGHELYTAGHLFQAAVAAGRTGVLSDLLAIAEPLAELLVRTLGADDDPYIDGHPEVETALVELYRATSQPRYLQLAQRQIDRRGHGWLGDDRFGSAYFQDHSPLRDTDAATGHAVRQLYLLAGAVDVAVETHDQHLLAAVVRIWDDLFTTKTYVTGAHGSRHRDEAIGDPYELPPDRAYAETCAAIASFQLNWRLLLATGEHRYADAMETVLYNAIAVSTAQSGTEFFYSNPLQLRTGHDGSHEDAPTQRLPWFSCACCPPNISRLLASIHDYLATTTGDQLVIHHYTAATITADLGATQLRARMHTTYPHSGTVHIEIDSTDGLNLSLRIPSWCTRFTVAIDGAPLDAEAIDGYLHVQRPWQSQATIELTLDMPVRVLSGHPRIDAIRGTAALARGAMLYALEQADLPGDVALEDVRLNRVLGCDVAPRPDLSPTAVHVELSAAPTGPAEPLYSSSDRRACSVMATEAHPGARGRPTPDRATRRTLTACLLPYHRWANREPGAMRVWIPLANSRRDTL